MHVPYDQAPLAVTPNGLLSIHILPDKLLSEVFDFAVIHARPEDVSGLHGDEAAKNLAGALNAITAVCSRWRAVALACPTLWRTIIYGEEIHVSSPSTLAAEARISTYLERSAQVSIDVSLDFSSGSTTIHLLNSLITPHTSRLRKIGLYFQSRNDEPRFLPIRGPLPKLEQFSCLALGGRGHPEPGHYPAYPIFERPTTIHKLVKLNITASFPHLSDLNFASLRHLYLSADSLFWPGAIDLLRQAQSLETLRLLMEGSASSHRLGQGSVLLDNLHDLVFSTPSLLSKLHTPNLKGLTLSSATLPESAGWPSPMPTWPYLERVTIIMSNTEDRHLKALLLANPSVKKLTTLLCANNKVVPKMLLERSNPSVAIEASNPTPMLLPYLELLDIGQGGALKERTLSTLDSLLQTRPNLRINCHRIVVQSLNTEPLLRAYGSRFKVTND